MDDLTAGDLRIEINEEPSAPIRLVWRGKSNDRAPSRVLAPFFATALATAGQRGVPLQLHFESIEHFNSSTITSVIQLIQDAHAAAVPLVLVYDKSLKWQKLSFDALRVFVRDGSQLELRSVK
jgi:hypothetical protein